MDLLEFRKKLDEISNNIIPSKQHKYLESLKKQYPHNISLDGNPSYYDSRDCFKYVFESQIDRSLRNKIDDLEKRNLLCDFANKLISEGALEVHDNKTSNDKIVIYFDGKIAKHFGLILANNTVISKWGGRGHVWRHGFNEVPLSYGGVIRYSCGTINKELIQKVISSFKDK